ncbi:MAG: hypothetical protein KJ956_14690, partial [Actinobacteria bacterium]|nr:hypothetical protein [Actinomycetota bacterium]
RAFRDALTEALLEELPEMASAVSLDGGPAHSRRDLNFDGCVYHREVDPPHPDGTITTPAAGDCADAPNENLFPRYDFNGDGRIGHQAAPFHGAELTDLQVLQAVWPDDNPELNEGWRAEDLDDLITGANGAGGSADLHFRPLYPLEDVDTYDQVRLSIPELSMERLLTVDVPEIVWTVPVRRELTLLVQGIRDGEPVEDLCASASLGDLLLGEDRRVTVAPCGVMITVTPDMRTRKLSAVCGSYEFDEELVDYGPGEAVVVNCPRLDSGESCALTREFSLEYGTGSLDVVVSRLDTTRFSITLNALGTPEIPPYPDAPSPGCGGLCGGGERIPCFTSALVGFEIDAVLWTGIEGPTHHDVSCSAGSEWVATSDLPDEYERFCFSPEWSEERAAVAVFRGSSVGGTWPDTPLDGCSASADNSAFYYGVEPLALDGDAAFDTDSGSGGGHAYRVHVDMVSTSSGSLLCGEGVCGTLGCEIDLELEMAVDIEITGR